MHSKPHHAPSAIILGLKEHQVINQIDLTHRGSLGTMDPPMVIYLVLKYILEMYLVVGRTLKSHPWLTG